MSAQVVVTGQSDTGNYELEFFAGGEWQPALFPARPLDEAIALVERMHLDPKGPKYRVVPSEVKF